MSICIENSEEITRHSITANSVQMPLFQKCQLERLWILTFFFGRHLKQGLDFWEKKKII